MFFLCTKHNFSNGTQSCPHCEKERGDKVTIDTKRLATDAAYWGEVGAPDKATSYCELIKCFTREEILCPQCIPRPTQKPEVEWDEAGEFPPIGSCVEARVYGEWQEVEIRGYGARFCIAGDEDGDDIIFEFRDDSFRPIRAKDQRLRDDLVDFVAAASGIRARDGRGAIALDIADAILSRYNLEPKD